MNSPRVMLTVVQGMPEGKEFVFDNHSWCMIGRAEDCDLRVPKDEEHSDVSRHHCLIEIDLPAVRLRDLGSRNGTFVNGMKIGQRSDHESAGEFDLSGFAAHELRDGDEIQIGRTVFQVTKLENDHFPELHESLVDCL